MTFRIRLPWRPERRRTVAPAVPHRTELRCVGAYLYGYEDRITVEWREGMRVELPVEWCVEAGIRPVHGRGLLKITIRFVPGAWARDAPDRGGADVRLLAPVHTLPHAQVIVRRLNERCERRFQARRRAAPAAVPATAEGGAVRDGDWVSFRPNPDTEELLAGYEAGPDSGHEHHR